MSATSGPDIIQKGFGGYQTLSRAQLRKQKDSLYRNSFRDLPDGTIYRDPMGVRAGEPVTLQKDFWDAMADSGVVEMWDRYQQNGFSVSQTVKEIRKNLDTGDWALPLDILPDVFVVNPEQTPMADLMARETTQSETVAPTPLTAHPDISWGLETTGDSEGSYDYDDPTYTSDLTYDVLGYGAATRLEDKMILAASSIPRAAESTTEAAFMRAMRQEEEAQIIGGQTTNDASGFQGFDDLGSTVSDAEVDEDTDSASDYENATRLLIDEVEHQGAPRESIAVVCDFDWHRRVRESLTNDIRYVDVLDHLDAGFQTFDLDGVPVFKSHAITRITDQSADSTNNQAYSVNMSAVYLSMLQETSVKPLAKVAPQEQFAVDAYGVLTDESDGAHIRIAQAESPA